MSRPLPSAALALLLCGGAAAEEPPQPSPSPEAPPAHPGDAATRFPRENLRALPRPADPWSLLREVPGVALDRVSVGGSETGLQQVVVSGGDGGGGTVWTLDGIDVTDPAALGSLAVFPDMDAVESVLARTRAVDVRVRTPGVRVDLLLRPPPDRFRGEVHLRGADDALQSDNLPAQLAERPFFRNRTERLTELGAEAGGGLRQGTLRLWGALSRNEHRQQSFTGHEETLRVTDLAAKARWDGRQGTLSALALRSEKVHEGRDTGLTTDPSARWRQSGPSHVVALEGRRGLGGFDTFARVSWLDGGFRLDAEGGPQANVFEDFRGVLQGSYYTFATDRPRLQALAETVGARDALGLRHTLLAGAGLPAQPGGYEPRVAREPGAGLRAPERVLPYVRPHRLRAAHARAGRPQRARPLRGLRPGPHAARPLRGHAGPARGPSGRAQPGVVGGTESRRAGLLPAVSFDGTPSRFTWLDVLPRAAVSFDLDRAGRTVARASYAAYGAELGSGDVTFDNPIGREPASLTYYWLDRNGDRAVQAGELDLLRGRLGSAGVDPRQPSSVVSPHVIDPDYHAPRTQEVAGAIETGLWGVRALVRASWRRHRGARCHAAAEPDDGRLRDPRRGAGHAVRRGVQRRLLRARLGVAHRAGHRPGAHQPRGLSPGVGHGRGDVVRPRRRAHPLVGLGRVRRLARVLRGRGARGAGPDAARERARSRTGAACWYAGPASGAATCSCTRAGTRARPWRRSFRCASRARPS